MSKETKMCLPCKTRETLGLLRLHCFYMNSSRNEEYAVSLISTGFIFSYQVTQFHLPVIDAGLVTKKQIHLIFVIYYSKLLDLYFVVTDYT